METGVVGVLQEGLGSYFVLVAKLYHQNSDQIKSLKIHLEGARDFCLCEIPTQVHKSPFCVSLIM